MKEVSWKFPEDFSGSGIYYNRVAENIKPTLNLVLCTSHINFFPQTVLVIISHFAGTHLNQSRIICTVTIRCAVFCLTVQSGLRAQPAISPAGAYYIHFASDSFNQIKWYLWNHSLHNNFDFVEAFNHTTPTIKWGTISRCAAWFTIYETMRCTALCLPQWT